ncbi:MAG: heavy metal translocating P-type ATPase [Synergistaceae bacterium]|nr:heavy metal translocating P-type ATPase [Synergistaceae bacterium]
MSGTEHKKEHHHDDEHQCSCCSSSGNENIFCESEEDENEERANFTREITFLSITGVIFVLLLATEEFYSGSINGVLLSSAFMILYLVCGLPVLKSAFRAILKFDVFNEFTLMGSATLSAVAIGEMSEAVGVMIFYRLGEAFQERTSSRSKRSIKALLATKPLFARIIKDGELIETDPKEIVKGDIIQVLPGEMIPIDGIIRSGASDIDSSSMTGESIPVHAVQGDQVHGGTLALDGLLTIEAAGPFEDSTIAKMLDMVQNAAARKSPTERFITRFAKWYTPAVFAIALMVAFIPPLTGHGEFRDWFYRGLVMLVISCPCALVISIPLGYFGGIGSASKRGILVKGANVFDALGKVTIAIFDKTGTLTYGRFKVTKVVPFGEVSREELLKTAAAVEMGSTHPVAASIIEAAGETKIDPDALMTQSSGKGMILTKGDSITAVGNTALMKDFGITAEDVSTHGTVVHVMKNSLYMGYIVLQDSLRKESGRAIRELREHGIKEIYMLTGDRESVAGLISDELGLNGYRSELMPEDKVEALKEICKGETQKTLYVGDGINDGPVLVTSETGIAMGGFGSQVAVEVADAVILDDSPLKVVELLRIAKKTRTIVWQNVFMALGVKGIFLIGGAAGIAGLWEAVFADVGVALLAILNSTRASKI